jgi:hypothetical protein
MCHYRLGDAAKAHECFEEACACGQRHAAALTPQQITELEQFRSEAEITLGLKEDSSGL